MNIAKTLTKGRFALIARAVAWSSVLVCQQLWCGQETLQITFDGPPPQPPGTQYGIIDYSEAGMHFTPIQYIPGISSLVRNGGRFSSPDNGTPYLQDLHAGLTVSSRSGVSFGLVSVDLAAYSVAVPTLNVDFVGYRADGSIVTDHFSGSGIKFQTYHFDSTWTDLTRVVVPFSPWSMDNLVVTVPEPASTGLVLLGLLLVGMVSRKRTGEPAKGEPSARRKQHETRTSN